MKKLLLGFTAGILLLLLGAVYFFIPDQIEIKASIAVKATRPGLYRMLLDRSSVAKWWPGSMKNERFQLYDFTYTIHKNNIAVLPIEINGQKTNLSSSLYFIPIIDDSTKLEWIATMPASYNPYKRFIAYLNAKEIKNGMAVILKQLENYYKFPENIYGFVIKKEFVKDSILIATSVNSNGYPTNEFIYSLIDKLTKYAAGNTAKQTGYPMLNITTTDSINFDLKVALPIDKALPTSGDILLKRMLGGGNILVTEVKGGISTTNKALDQIKNFADDYERIPPAIPFYSLITDRLKEPDSSKWITKIYYPVK